MSAPLAGKFQDHYVVLGIEPKSDSETIHRAYTELVARYKEAEDQEKLDAVTQAYEVLADPSARATFDSIRSGPEKEQTPVFSGMAFFDGITKELALRQTILCVLYDRKRQKPLKPGLNIRQMEAMMDANAEELQFSIWYLKQRGLVTADDKSNMLITMTGMESIEKNTPPPELIFKLLKSAPPATPSSELAQLAQHVQDPEPAQAEVPAPPERQPVASEPPAVELAAVSPFRKIVIPPRRK